jgi:hypothetical protein
MDDWIYWHLIQSTRNYRQYSGDIALYEDYYMCFCAYLAKCLSERNMFRTNNLSYVLKVL